MDRNLDDRLMEETVKRLSERYIMDLLEFQTTQAFRAIEYATATGKPVDAKWAGKLYDALGEVITESIRYQPFMQWRRDHPLAPSTDIYILQYVIGSGACSVMEERFRGVREETDMTEGKLREMIDQKEPYCRIRLASRELAKVDVLGVKNVIKYVRGE